MALINCPECKAQVSDKAASCPKCGYAIADNLPKRNKERRELSKFEKDLNKFARNLLIIAGVIITLIFYFMPTEEEMVLRHQKERKEKIKIERDLYEKVKNLPASKIAENRDGYKKLHEMNLNNKLYKDKYNYYNDLLSKKQDDTHGNKHISKTINSTKKITGQETMLLYDEFNIEAFDGGRQVSKSYFINESISQITADIFSVDTYRKVTDSYGNTEYKSSFHINCRTNIFKFARHWSSGFGEDRGELVNGEWSQISEYEEMINLAKHVCSDN